MVFRCRTRLAAASVAFLLLAACGGGPPSDDGSSSQDTATDSAVEVAPVVIDGLPLGPLGETSDPAHGQPMPQLSGTAIDGSPFTWTPGERPAAFVFLAHWCPACQAEVTELTEWLEQGNELPAGVDLLSIVTLVDPESDNYPPSQWLAEEGWPFPALVDSVDNETSAALGQSGTPFWLFVYADGTVALRGSGRIGPDTLSGYFDQLLALG